MKKITLYVSLGAALNAIVDGRVDLEALSHCLFFFLCHTSARVSDVDDCVRRYALRADTDHQQKVRAAHSVLMAALSRAETENRIAWKNWPERSVYDDLHRLLTSNGQEPPTPMPQAQQDTWQPGFLEVVEVCPHVEVVYS